MYPWEIINKLINNWLLTNLWEINDIYTLRNLSIRWKDDSWIGHTILSLNGLTDD